MDSKKASAEYGYAQLREDFPELTEQSAPNIVLPPLIHAIWKRIRAYLIRNTDGSSPITHIRDMSDPHFVYRTYEMVIRGRIIDISVGFEAIDEKDFCNMACKMTLSSELCDVSTIRDLMIQIRDQVRTLGLESLKTEAREYIKKALHDDTHLCLEHIYSRVRSFYGNHELQKFEHELCALRQASANA